MTINDLFDIEYPKTLIYSEMTPCNDKLGINFVSSQEKDNGVVGKVEKVDKLKLYPAGIITVPLKGSVLMACLQTEPCYVAHQIAVLAPKNEMTLQEKLFYCFCIRQNAFKFNYGRQADKTLKHLELPDSIPAWVYAVSITPYTTANASCSLALRNASEWKEISVSDLFTISVSKDNNVFNSDSGTIPYVASSSLNNGVTALVDSEPSQSANTLTIARNGSVGSTFYQPNAYCASPDDVRVLTPKFPMNVYVGLFIKTIIECEKFKFGYGRKLGTARIKKLVIKLPFTEQGYPDWEYMEKYIRALPYADKIKPKDLITKH